MTQAQSSAPVDWFEVNLKAGIVFGALVMVLLLAFIFFIK